MAPTTVVIANRKGGIGKTLTTIYTSRWLARMGRRVIINDLDPQRGIWDFADALGRPHGRILKHLAVVDPDASPPFEPDYVLVDTPPALDVSLPAMNTADWLIVPVIPDHQPVVQLAKFLEALEETRFQRLWGGKTSDVFRRLARRCGVVRSTPVAIGQCLWLDAP
jgi:chromosome partitioning protein